LARPSSSRSRSVAVIRRPYVDCRERGSSMTTV
jgi:hypothetical protein